MIKHVKRCTLKNDARGKIRKKKKRSPRDEKIGSKQDACCKKVRITVYSFKQQGADQLIILFCRAIAY